MKEKLRLLKFSDIKMKGHWALMIASVLIGESLGSPQCPT